MITITPDQQGAAVGAGYKLPLVEGAVMEHQEDIRIAQFMNDCDELRHILTPFWGEMSQSIRRSARFLNEYVEHEAEVDEVDHSRDEDVDRDGDGDGDGDDDVDGDDSGTHEFPWDEFNRMKRQQAEVAKQQRKAEKEAKRAREREQRESGQYDEILTEKEEEIAAAAARAEAAEYQLEEFQRRLRITGAASRLGFRDPEDAIRFLHEDDTEDDVSTERALKRLAREKKYLLDERRSTGVPVRGESGSTLTVEDVKKMSESEINNRWEEVQDALRAGTM